MIELFISSLYAANSETVRVELEQQLKAALQLTEDPFSKGLQQISEQKLIEKCLEHFRKQYSAESWNVHKIRNLFQHPLLCCSRLLKKYAAESFAYRNALYRDGIRLRIRDFNRLIECLPEKTRLLLQSIISYLETFNITEENLAPFSNIL